MNTPTGSESYRKLNPHLFSPALNWGSDPDRTQPRSTSGQAKRIRQSSKPILNRLEQEFCDWLIDHQPVITTPVLKQAITFKLANGLRYTPDLFSFDWYLPGEFSGPVAWEVKGPHAFEGSLEKVKMFAHAYPEIRVILAWKDEAGEWQKQRILA